MNIKRALLESYKIYLIRYVNSARLLCIVYLKTLLEHLNLL